MVPSGAGPSCRRSPTARSHTRKGAAMSDTRSLNVLIAGGGAAALEAAFGLQRVAADRVDVTILAPDELFATHALAVLVPFAAGHTPHEPLARIASDAGARLHRGRMASVDA